MVTPRGCAAYSYIVELETKDNPLKKLRVFWKQLVNHHIALPNAE